MQKKAHLTLTLKAGEKPHVNKGDHVKRGDILIESQNPVIYEFNLAHLFKLPPQKALLTLLVKPHQHVEKGTVLARKKSILSKHFIKTPIGGVMVNSDNGIVGIQAGDKAAPVAAWFEGKATDVSDSKLIFEVIGTVCAGKSGKGSPASGKLLVVSEVITSLQMPIDLEERIFAVKTASSDIVAKADALGATAIIAETLDQPLFSLPYLLIEDIKELVRYNHKTVIICGDEKELLIIEEASGSPRELKK